jgi:hypothetical protein
MHPGRKPGTPEFRYPRGCRVTRNYQCRKFSRIRKILQDRLRRELLQPCLQEISKTEESSVSHHCFVRSIPYVTPIGGGCERSKRFQWCSFTLNCAPPIASLICTYEACVTSMWKYTVYRRGGKTMAEKTARRAVLRHSQSV